MLTFVKYHLTVHNSVLVFSLISEHRHAGEMLHYRRQGPVYHSYSIPLLLMTWRHNGPGYQQPRYWPRYVEYSGFRTRKVKFLELVHSCKIHVNINLDINVGIIYTIQESWMNVIYLLCNWTWSYGKGAYDFICIHVYTLSDACK